MQCRTGRLLRFGRVSAAMMVFGALTAGCSKKSEESAPSNSQVIARVGSEVITAPEYENELRLLGIPPDKQKEPEVVRRVLSEMVTRKYLTAQAATAKLDREPNVLLELLRSREQVLSAAFLSKTVSTKLSAITTADIEKYIANNPSKFGGRELLAVEQIVFPLNVNTQAIIDATKEFKSLEDVDQRLISMAVPHHRSVGSLNSGDVPDDLINSMKSRKADDIFFVRSGQNGVLFKVRNEEPRPLEGEAATNAARQYIRNDLLKAETGVVSMSANFEAKFEGAYAKMMSVGSNEPAGLKN